MSILRSLIGYEIRDLFVDKPHIGRDYVEIHCRNGDSFELSSTDVDVQGNCEDMIDAPVVEVYQSCYCVEIVTTLGRVYIWGGGVRGLRVERI